MAHDSDVARVAAALKSPGIRYRNFGNEPVRSAATPVGNPDRSFPLLGAAMDAEAGRPVPHPDPIAAPDVQPAAEFAPYAVPEPAEVAAPEPAPTVPETVAPRPAPPAAATPDAPAERFPFGAPPAYPQPAPFVSLAPAAFPEFAAPGLGLAPAGRRPAERATGSYRLLESLGMPGEPPSASPRPPTMPEAPSRATTSTMQSLGRAAASAQSSPAQPSLIQPGGEPPAMAAEVPGQPAFAGPLPAAMVTLPLAEVLRLIATGVSAAPSPFAALRVPGGATNSR